LDDAIKGESCEIDTVYLEFSEKAKIAGNTAAAARFEEIRHDERGHRATFKIALARLKS
jgi:rubrerythrin